jgi:hypothetical protein
LARGVLVAAAGTAALSLAGPFALRPFTDVAGAAGDVTVAFVLDFGAPSLRLVVGCVSVPASDNRYQALAAFTAQEGLASPTYAPSGLLCSINGVPSSGCGQVVSGGYVYWSYFTGSATGWTYASTGAFGTVTPNDVEGWRFQDPGTGRPSDPAPRFTGQFRAICPPTPPTTTTTTAAPKAGGGGAGKGARATGAVAATHRARVEPTKTHKVKDAGAAQTSGSGSTTTATQPSGPLQTIPPVSVPPDPAVGVASVAKTAPAGVGPDPVIVGGLLVAGLAVAAYARWRRRTRQS